MEERLFSAEEVCVLLDCSVHSLNIWYKFKRQNPDNEYAKMLPEITNKTNGARTKRYWKESDIVRLIEFKAAIPHGRNGVLGSVTQKYAKKRKCVKDGRKNKETHKKGRKRA